MKEQKYFERDLYNLSQYKEDVDALQKLLKDGWKIVIAIPIQYGKSCYTYTSHIHYVLEKEVLRDEKQF